MILPFITDSLTSIPENVNIIPFYNNIEEKKDEHLLTESSGKSTIEVLPEEEDSYEVKYRKLMEKIEKERFERELIAGSR